MNSIHCFFLFLLNIFLSLFAIKISYRIAVIYLFLPTLLLSRMFKIYIYKTTKHFCTFQFPLIAKMSFAGTVSRIQPPNAC